jgi:hypothetical protein
MLQTDYTVLPETEETPGASCPKEPTEPCDVRGWFYVTDSKHPRMYGRCFNCEARYCIVLPERLFGEAITRPMMRTLLKHSLDDVRAAAQEQVRDDIVVKATEHVLRRSGNSQSLWYVVRENPLAIRREILIELEALSRQAAIADLHERREELNSLLDMVRARIVALDDERWESSYRSKRTRAIKAHDAWRAMIAKIARLRPELTAMQRDRQGILDEIRAARAAAKRDPLPMPAGYEPPTLDQRMVLCDAIAPPEVIYALIDPADPELVRYVGRTCDPVHRYRNHCTSGTETVSAWVGEVISAGRRPAMVLLERCEAEVVGEREAHWIHHYRDRFQADLNASIPRRMVYAND